MNDDIDDTFLDKAANDAMAVAKKLGLSDGEDELSCEIAAGCIETMRQYLLINNRRFEFSRLPFIVRGVSAYFLSINEASNESTQPLIDELAAKLNRRI